MLHIEVTKRDIVPCTNKWVLEGAMVSGIREDFPSMKVITIPVNQVAPDSVKYFATYHEQRSFNHRYCHDVAVLLDYFGCSLGAYQDLVKRLENIPQNPGDRMMRAMAFKRLEKVPNLTIPYVQTTLTERDTSALVRSGLYTSKFLSEFADHDCLVLADWKIPPDTPLLREVKSRLKGQDYDLTGEYMMAHSLGLDTSKLTLVIFTNILRASKHLGFESTSKHAEARLRCNLSNLIRLYDKGTISNARELYFGLPETQVLVSSEGDVYAAPAWHMYNKFMYQEYLELKAVPLPLNTYQWCKTDKYFEDVAVGPSYTKSCVHFEGGREIPSRLARDVTKRILTFVTEVRLTVDPVLKQVCLSKIEERRLFKHVQKDLPTRVACIYEAASEPMSHVEAFTNDEYKVRVLANVVADDIKKELLLVLTIV